MKIVEIEVILEDVIPVVRRVIEVPLKIKLSELHLTIQSAFGWENMHLYQFSPGEPYQLGGKNWVSPDFWVAPDFMEEPENMSAEEYTLAQAITLANPKPLTYVYDFGDDWIHTLKIGEAKEHALGVRYPLLIDVEGTCPPEDVGGVYGYAEFLDAMKDKKHEQHQETKRWYGGIFKPNDPPVEKLQKEVQLIAL